MVKDNVTALLKTALASIGVVDAKVEISHPTFSEHGDYATNVAMKYAKELRLPPMELAQKIKEALPQSDLINRVEVAKPGFINIYLSSSKILEETAQFAQKSFNPTLLFEKKNRIAIVEYSSPNIAKPFTIGHLRSTIIGDSIANLLEVIGYEVKRDNHVGDWGTQFGKLIYAIETWGDIEKIENSPRPIKELVNLYVKFHEEAEINPEIEDIARNKFKLLEDGDETIRNYWQKCVEWSWKEFDYIYKKLGITFTENDGKGYGESYFEKTLKNVLTALEEKKLLTKSEGAQIVEFNKNEFPPLMIQKKDGASLYATRDLATDRFRLNQYGNDILIINEVGAEQTLYFRQLYKVEGLLGWFQPEQRIHVKHGLYRFKDQKMSTRKGNTIWLEDVIEEAIQRAVALDTNGKKDQVKSEHRVTIDHEKIAIAALKWNDLKHSPDQDVIFDWEQILNMEGNSGPYLLYTIVRAKSVLSKSEGFNDVRGEVSLEIDEEEIVRLIHKFPEIIEQAAESHLPSTLATYLYQLAQKYNVFYHNSPILKSEGKTKDLRLMITTAVSNILSSGLHLLGIKTVEKM